MDTQSSRVQSDGGGSQGRRRARGGTGSGKGATELGVAVEGPERSGAEGFSLSPVSGECKIKALDMQWGAGLRTSVWGRS